MMQVTPVKNQSQVNPSFTLMLTDLTSLILGDSGTLFASVEQMIVKIRPFIKGL